MGDKYELRDKDGRKIGTAEKQLTPVEQAQRGGEQAALWLIIFAIFGGFVILIPAWIFIKVAQLTGRYPKIMVPLIIAAIAVPTYAVITMTAQANALTSLIKVQTINVRYTTVEDNRRVFRIEYQISNTDTNPKNLAIRVQVPVTFSDCPRDKDRKTEHAMIFGGLPSDTSVIRNIYVPSQGSIKDIALAETSDQGGPAASYICASEGCSKWPDETKCRTYRIGEPVYKIRLDKPLGAEWQLLGTNNSTAINRNTAVPVPTIPAAQSTEQPSTLQNDSSRQVTADGLRLRALPGTDQRVITRLKKGTVVTLLGETRSLPDGSTWVKVRIVDQEGWVSEEFIEIPK
jgi:hypothetical protein